MNPGLKWLSLLAAFLFGGGGGFAAAVTEKAADLFQLTNIWSAHLIFSAEEWRAMEPKGGEGGFGGGRGFGGGPQWMRPGGMGTMLGPLFMREGDQNQDERLSKEEFRALGKKWFAAWDQSGEGKVSIEELMAGLNALMMRPGYGAPRRGLQGPEGGRNGVAARSGVEFEFARAKLQFEDQMLSNVAARYKGNGTFLRSRFAEKRSMKVDLNKWVKGQKVADRATLNFHSNALDASWMNEPLSHRLHRDAGNPAPRTAYARVNVTVPPDYKDHYLGLYSLVENVDEDFIKDYFHTKGGALFKPVTPSLFEDLGKDWADYKQTYDPKVEPKKEEIARVMEMCRLVTWGKDEEFAARLGDFIDLEAFARYMAVAVFLTDMDGIMGPGQNYYMYLHPETKRFHFIAWDQDNSFGQMRGSQEDREQLSIMRPWQGENRFLERVFKVETFKKLYRARLEEFSKTIFQPERLRQQVDELAPVLRAAIGDESPEKLQRFDDAVAGNIVESDGDFRPYGRAKPIKGFVGPRQKSIVDQLAGKSDGAQIFGRGGGGPWRRGPEPGIVLGGLFMRTLDANGNNEITAAEMETGFAKWFERWNTDKSETLSDDELRVGLNRDVMP